MTGKRVRTPDGEGELVGQVVKDGKVTALVVLLWNYVPTQPAVKVNGIGVREVVAYPLCDYIEVKDGSKSILRRVG